MHPESKNKKGKTAKKGKTRKNGKHSWGRDKKGKKDK